MQMDIPVTIQSPNYPHRYFDNLDCVWFFRSAAFTANNSYVFRILDMQLFSLRRLDFLRIGRGYNVTSGEKVVDLTHHVPQGTVIVVEGHSSVWIRFYSDFDYRQRGFEMEVTRRTRLGNMFIS